MRLPLVLIILGTACGNGPARGGSLQNPVTASRELTKLPVLIKVATADECAKRGGVDLMISEVRRELVNAGMSVVSSDQEPHKLIAELSFLVTDCHKRLRNSFEGTIKLTVRGEGRSIYQGEFTETEYYGFFNKERTSFLEPAQFMVRKALSAMAVNQFALELAEREARPQQK